MATASLADYLITRLMLAAHRRSPGNMHDMTTVSGAPATNCRCHTTIAGCVDAMGLGEDAPAVILEWSTLLGNLSAQESKLVEEAYRKAKKGSQIVSPILSSTEIPFDDLLSLWASRDLLPVSVPFAPPAVPEPVAHLMCLYMACTCTFEGCATSSQPIGEAQKWAFASVALTSLPAILAEAVAAQQHAHASAAGTDAATVSLLQVWRARVVTAALQGIASLHSSSALRAPLHRTALLAALPYLLMLLQGGSCGCPGRFCVNSGSPVAPLAGGAVTWVPAAREALVILSARIPAEPMGGTPPVDDALSHDQAMELVRPPTLALRSVTKPAAHVQVEVALDLMQEMALHHVCAPGLTQVYNATNSSSVVMTLTASLQRSQVVGLRLRACTALYTRIQSLLAQLHPFRSPHAIRMYTDIVAQSVPTSPRVNEDVLVLTSYLELVTVDAFAPVLQLLAPPGEVHPDMMEMLESLATTLAAELSPQMRAAHPGRPAGDVLVEHLRMTVNHPFGMLQDLVSQHLKKEPPRGFGLPRPTNITLHPHLQRLILSALVVGPFADRVFLPYARAQPVRAYLPADWQDPTQLFAVGVACLAVEAAATGVLPRHSEVLHGIMRLMARALPSVRGSPAGVAAAPFVKQLVDMAAAGLPARMDDATSRAFAALRSQVGATSAQQELLRCVWMDDADGVRASVAAGADPDSETFVNALEAAAAFDNAHAMRALLTPPVRARVVRQGVLTALQYACQYGHAQTLRVMLDTGTIRAFIADVPHFQMSAVHGMALTAYGTAAAPLLAEADLPVLPELPACVETVSMPSVQERMPMLSNLQAACLCGDPVTALAAAAACGGDDWDALCAPPEELTQLCGPISPLILAIVADALDVVTALLNLPAVRTHVNDGSVFGRAWRALDFGVVNRSVNACSIVEQLLGAEATADERVWQLWSERNSAAMDIGRLLAAASEPSVCLRTQSGSVEVGTCLIPLFVQVEQLREWHQQQSFLTAIKVSDKTALLPTVRSVLSVCAHYARRKHVLRHRMWSSRRTTDLIVSHSTAPDPLPRFRFGALRLLSACKSKAACAAACTVPQVLMLSLPPIAVTHDLWLHGRLHSFDSPASVGIPHAPALVDSEQRVPLCRVWRFVHNATGLAVVHAWMVAAAAASGGDRVPLDGLLPMDCAAVAQSRLQAASAAPAKLMGPCIRFVAALLTANPTFVAAPCARGFIRSLAEALPGIVSTYGGSHDYEVDTFLPVYAAGDASVRDVLLQHATAPTSNEETATAALEALGALAHSHEPARVSFCDRVCSIVAAAALQPRNKAQDAMRTLKLMLQRSGWAAQVDGKFGPSFGAWKMQVPTDVRSRILSTVFEMRRCAPPNPAAAAAAAPAAILSLSDQPADAPICTGARLRMPCNACGRAMFAIMDIDLTDRRMTELRALLGGERQRLIFPFCGTCHLSSMETFESYEVLFLDGGRSDWEAGVHARRAMHDVEATRDGGGAEDDTGRAAVSAAAADALSEPAHAQLTYRSHKLGATLQLWSRCAGDDADYPSSCFGGYPRWPQDDEYEHCSRCTDEMVYIACMRPYELGLQIDPDTTLHLFVCATCRVRGAVQVLAPA